MKYLLTVTFFCYITLSANAQYPLVLSQREQAKVMNEIQDDRLHTLLPALMRQDGIDMWIILSREHNEDPVIETLLPATWMGSQRTTMLVIFDRGADKELEYLAIARYDAGSIFKLAWDPVHQPDQWAQLSKIVEERSPKKIAINRSEHFGHADGLTANDYDKLRKTLTNKSADKIVSAEKLVVRWLETRTERELILYQQACRITHEIIQQGFSDEVIHPGVTTTDDVAWWYREKIKELKLDTWFQPTVTVQRNEADAIFSKRPQPLVIMPGDLLHIDLGITYLRLNTNAQQHAYVLRSDERDAPDYLKKAFLRGNKLQDILTRNFATGKSGNQVLTETRQQAIDQGLTPYIYTHPIGVHGYGAGPAIGLPDMQMSVPFNGDYLLNPNTAYSTELGVNVYLIEWKKEIQIKLEEDGIFSEAGFRYTDGRQTDLILIPRPGKVNKQ